MFSDTLGTASSAPDDPFETDLSRRIWETRYRYRSDSQVCDQRVEDTWLRVSRALAAAEPHDQAGWAERFFGLMRAFRFLPGGRILAGAGTERDVTLCNCFVMGPIDDAMEAIFEALKEGAVTMQAGGGVGYDFSTLRPKGVPARRVGGLASGPVSFMRIWDAMCETLLSTASRRGAMMATLRCDHPDIETFVDAKRDPRALRNFNLSVLVTDDFMAAVEADRPWPLVFPLAGLGGAAHQGALGLVHRRLPGSPVPVPCAVVREVSAPGLWNRIMAASFETAEPGVLFVDQINRENNLHYHEHISATNPCGEIPLPPYGACVLGSLNLVQFVQRPFTADAGLDLAGLQDAAGLAVRMLDAAIDCSRFPLPRQAAQSRGARRLGLGITGLADALIMLGLHYGSPQARSLAARVMEHICHAAYRASVALARERGPFPYFDAEPYLDGPFVRRLPDDIRAGIRAYGIRNSHLTAIAPAGTISLLANAVSSGLEPVYDFACRRRVLDGAGEGIWHTVTDYALRHWRLTHGDRPLPAAFVDIHALTPADHLAMQAALQPYVDNAIAKTINVPADIEFGAFRDLYAEAYRLGLKGCTSFRPNPTRGSVFADLPQGTQGDPFDPGASCCGGEGES
jgi:ribonucleoside-diphosphate reductase alpha chain